MCGGFVELWRLTAAAENGADMAVRVDQSPDDNTVPSYRIDHTVRFHDQFSDGRYFQFGNDASSLSEFLQRARRGSHVIDENSRAGLRIPAQKVNNFLEIPPRPPSPDYGSSHRDIR